MFPFGIQIKGFIIGLLFAYFVLPWIMGVVGNRTARNTGA